MKLDRTLHSYKPSTLKDQHCFHGRGWGPVVLDYFSGAGFEPLVPVKGTLNALAY